MKSSEYNEYYHKVKKYANKITLQMLKYLYNETIIVQHYINSVKEY